MLRHSIFFVIKTKNKQKTEVLPLCHSEGEETALSRLHVGHSHVTQSFLLKGEVPPFCIS